MIILESVTFFPVVYEYCWTGVSEKSLTMSRHPAATFLVKSPYMRLYDTRPSKISSFSSLPMYLADTFSVSINRAIVKFSFSISLLYFPRRVDDVARFSPKPCFEIERRLGEQPASRLATRPSDVGRKSRVFLP